MNYPLNSLPKVLIFSRLVLGVTILALSFFYPDKYKIISICLLTIGLLTDIFDGMIARQLQISTQHLRRLDSTIDQVFFMMVGIATFIECRQFFYDNKLELFILLGAEALTYLVCFIKFRKEIATHAISSKIWTLFLFATLVQVMASCSSTILFQWCFYIGLVTRLEIVGIILLIRQWTNDVPSIYHAVLLRQGKEIKRHKIFNG